MGGGKLRSYDVAKFESCEASQLRSSGDWGLQSDEIRNFVSSEVRKERSCQACAFQRVGSSKVMAFGSFAVTEFGSYEVMDFVSCDVWKLRSW